jgi:hypothetical protein
MMAGVETEIFGGLYSGKDSDAAVLAVTTQIRQ